MNIDEILYKIQNPLNLENITYEQYCIVLDSLLVGNSLNEISLVQIQKELFILFKQLRVELGKLSTQFKISKQEIVAIFKSRDGFGMLHAFGFNIRLMLKAIQELTKFVREGLLTIFKELSKTKAVQKLRRGFITIDELIQQHPKLAKITGLAVAGLLLFIWLNMTFIGDFEYDFDFGHIADAIEGKFSIADLFMSPEGLMLMTLFGTGVAFGLSVPWLGTSLYNLITAVIYTLSKKMKEGGWKFDRRLTLMWKRIGKEKL